MEFDVFSRVSEYHAIENYKGDSKWGSWIPMSDHPAADGIALVDGESNDSRKLFVAVRDFSEEDISLLKQMMEGPSMDSIRKRYQGSILSRGPKLIWDCSGKGKRYPCILWYRPLYQKHQENSSGR